MNALLLLAVIAILWTLSVALYDLLRGNRSTDLSKKLLWRITFSLILFIALWVAAFW